MTAPHTPQAMTIPPLAACHILHLFNRNEPGVDASPDGFTRALLDAIVKADTVSLDLLMLGFPEYVAAYRMAAFRSDGIERLQQIARAA